MDAPLVFTKRAPTIRVIFFSMVTVTMQGWKLTFCR